MAGTAARLVVGRPETWNENRALVAGERTASAELGTVAALADSEAARADARLAVVVARGW